jgi:hypothetical protein
VGRNETDAPHHVVDALRIGFADLLLHVLGEWECPGEDGMGGVILGLFNDEIAKNATALETTNIPVIQRIKRLPDSVALILSTHDPRLMLEAAKTLTVLGWIEYMRGMHYRV